MVRGLNFALPHQPAPDSILPPCRDSSIDFELISSIFNSVYRESLWVSILDTHLSHCSQQLEQDIVVSSAKRAQNRHSFITPFIHCKCGLGRLSRPI